MSETIAVVEREKALEEAYRMGHDRFKDVDEEMADIDGFHDSATYANHTLPDLRALAGNADRGHGTYQVGRKIALIPGGNEDDHPAEAELTESDLFYQELVDAWHTGAYDGAEGTFDPESVMY